MNFQEFSFIFNEKKTNNKWQKKNIVKNIQYILNICDDVSQNTVGFKAKDVHILHYPHIFIIIIIIHIYLWRHNFFYFFFCYCQNHVLNLNVIVVHYNFCISICWYMCYPQNKFFLCSCFFLLCLLIVNKIKKSSLATKINVLNLEKVPWINIIGDHHQIYSAVLIVQDQW